MDSDVPDSSIAIGNYNIFRMDRANGTGGGLLCYIRNIYSCSVVSCESVISMSQSQTEFLVLYVNEFSLVLIIIYHPHWNNSFAHDDAISCIVSLIDFTHIKFGRKIRHCLLGDFNDLRKYYDTLSSLTMLTPIVNFFHQR